jgi:hypothetical protein
MSEIESRIEIIKKMRGTIIEYLSKDCLGCVETAPSLRDHICFSKEWFVHCSDYWEKVVEDLELQSELGEILLKYYVILTLIDPIEVDPEDDEILRKMWIDDVHVIKLN